MPKHPYRFEVTGLYVGLACVLYAYEVNCLLDEVVLGGRTPDEALVTVARIERLNTHLANEGTSATS